MKLLILWCLIAIYAIGQTEAADCNGLLTTYQVSVAYKCPTTNAVCYKSETKTKFVVSGCSGCGGCGGSVTSQRICDVQVQREETYSKAGTCSRTSGGWFWRRSRTSYYTCYSQATRRVNVRVEKYCCEGTTQVDVNTCASCGMTRLDKSDGVTIKPGIIPGIVFSGLHPTIVGGKPADKGEIPWQTLLTIFRPGKTYPGVCGAVIVAKRYVLTAAHCVIGRDTSATNRVHAGLDAASLGKYTYHDIQTVQIHPSYNPSIRVSSYDIAVVKTKTEMVFNDYIRPACLPKYWNTYYGETVQISGWGSTNGQPILSSVLKYASASVIPEPFCYAPGLLNMVCAQAGSRTTAGSSCYGDSGGPMTYRKNGNGPAVVIAVAWWARTGCPVNSPFGYTDVGRQLPWINSQMF